MTDRDDFELWVRTHRQHFLEEFYNNEDIVRLGLACGFSKETVYSWQAAQTKKAAKVNL